MYSSARMRAFIGSATLAVCALGPPVHAQDHKEARAIIDKAVSALGGEKKLQTKVFTWRMNMGEGRTAQVTLKGLDLYHHEIVFTHMGETTRYLMVMNGDKCWTKVGDKPTTLKNVKDSPRPLPHPIMLLPLKDRAFTLKPAGEKEIDGRQAVGVHVTEPGAKDPRKYTLYFDRDSGLPIRKTATDPGDAKRITEVRYSAYKDFDGIKVATRTEFMLNGKVDSTWEITEFRVLNEADVGTFDEPK